MHGEKEYKGKDHILLVGSTDETEQLIEQIQKDTAYTNRDVVIVAGISRHPLPDIDDVFFVKVFSLGEILPSRSCIIIQSCFTGFAFTLSITPIINNKDIEP